MKNPLLAIKKEASDKLEVTCSRLGLNPSGRSRLKVLPDEEKRSKWEGFGA